MNAKRILFIVLCALLVITLIMASIVIFKLAEFGLFEILFPSSESESTSPKPTAPDPTVPSEKPTDPEATVHEHNFVLTESVKPTCTGYGWNVYTCQTCNHVHMPENERIAPLKHDYGEGKVIKEATCTEGGLTEYACTRCGHVDASASKETEPLGHNYDHGHIYEATCTEGGYTKFTCLRCGVDELKDQTDPVGHRFEKPVSFPATCTEDAYSAIACTYEGCTEMQDKVIEVGTAPGHTPEEWTVMETGELVQKCSTCHLPTGELYGEKDYSILFNFQQTHTDADGITYVSHTVTIGVSNDPSTQMVTYTIYDYLGNDTLSLSFQSGLGFVLEYLDQENVSHYCFINQKTPLTIMLYSDGGLAIE